MPPEGPKPALPDPPSRATALIGTTLLFALAVLTVVPPLTMTLLAIEVAAVEYSPLVALGALLWLPMALVLLRPARGLQAAAGAATLLAAALALRPLAEFDATARRAAVQLGGAPRAFSLADMLRGAPSGAAAAERTVRYAAGDGTPLALHLYEAPGTGAHPAIVVIYGGAWRSGDPAQGERTSRALAARGYTVAAIDYRHVPAARYPAQLDDVRRSLALLRDSSAAWRIDTARMALLGRSSGGHLAELAAFTNGAPGIRAVVAIYAPFDLAQGYAQLPSPDPLGVRAVLRDFLGGTPDDQPARYRDASPSSHVRAGLPPVLLLYGARDHAVLPDFNRQAARALRAAGVRVVQVEIPWAEHGFDHAPGGLGAQLAYDAMVRFLDRELAASQREPRRGIRPWRRAGRIQLAGREQQAARSAR